MVQARSLVTACTSVASASEGSSAARTARRHPSACFSIREGAAALLGCLIGESALNERTDNDDRQGEEDDRHQCTPSAFSRTAIEVVHVDGPPAKGFGARPVPSSPTPNWFRWSRSELLYC